jgi:hypothetical protein
MGPEGRRGKTAGRPNFCRRPHRSGVASAAGSRIERVFVRVVTVRRPHRSEFAIHTKPGIGHDPVKQQGDAAAGSPVAATGSIGGRPAGCRGRPRRENASTACCVPGQRRLHTLAGARPLQNRADRTGGTPVRTCRVSQHSHSPVGGSMDPMNRGLATEPCPLDHSSASKR